MLEVFSRQKFRILGIALLAPNLEENGVKYLFVVLPQGGIGKFSAGKTADLYNDQDGMRSFEVGSIDEALKILKEANAI